MHDISCTFFFPSQCRETVQRIDQPKERITKSPSGKGRSSSSARDTCIFSSMAKKTSKAEALAAKQTRFSEISQKHNSRGNKLAKQAAKSTVKRVPDKRGSRFNI